jgi:SH3-like domain-containing protein
MAISNGGTATSDSDPGAASRRRQRGSAFRGNAGRRGTVMRCPICAHLAVALLAVVGLKAMPASGAENAAKLPRFASLRSDDINLRVGPGQTYPIEWVLKRKDMPVEIVEQFQNWRMVRVWPSASGWVLDRMVDGERHVIVDGAVRTLHRRPDAGSQPVARAEPGVVAKLIECRGDWCRIAAGGYQGWLRRGDVWGVLPGEAFP